MADDEFKRKVKKLADKITDLWSDFFINLSLNNYTPPVKAAGAKLLGIDIDQFSLALKQNTDVFREYGVLFMPIKKAGKILLLNRIVYKKYSQILCDIYDAIDVYDFENPVRDAAGTRRMDFAHEIAEHMHSKGCKQKKAAQLEKDYKAVLDNKAGKSEEILAVAQFIVKLMKETHSGRNLK